MTYVEVVDKIENIRRFGTLAGVDVSAQMLETFDNPQKGMRLVHIAGTNGKGSVSAFLCEILREAGRKVGVFTSPHLVDFRERICVNGEKIPKERVKEIGEMLLSMDFGVSPSMFDYCLLMALLYFKEQQCDVVILETGLGGRLDSTNAVGIPEITVITKIGYDHMAILGDTLEEIASEKAGIIKQGTTLILESQEKEVLPVFYDAAKKVQVQKVRLVNPREFLDCRYENGEQIFSYGGYEDLRMQMLGVHQYENAAAAIAAAEELLQKGEFLCTDGKLSNMSQNGNGIGSSDVRMCRLERCVRTGIARTHWMGRMEILRREPFLMVDGAHNSNGVLALKNSLMSLFPGEKFHFIMGVMADKDYERMVEELLPLSIDFKTITVESERALHAEALAEYICKRNVPAECVTDLQECLAVENADVTGKTVALGSLYFVGEIEAIFKK